MRVLNIGKKLLISGGLSLALVILLSDFTSAQSRQTQMAADKSWNAFWTKFNAAVKTGNHQSLMALTSKRFFSPDGETIRQWLNDRHTWRRLRSSVKKGTKPHTCRIMCRITRNADPVFGLVFVFENNRWGFTGERGE